MSIHTVVVKIEHDASKYRIIIDNMTALDGLNARLTSILTVYELDNAADRGMYKCTAENPIGTAFSDYYLRIRYEYAYVVPMAGIIAQLIVFLFCVACFKDSKHKDVEQPIARVNIVQATDTASSNRREQPVGRESTAFTDAITVPPLVDANRKHSKGSIFGALLPHDIPEKIDEEKSFQENKTDV